MPSEPKPGTPLPWFVFDEFMILSNVRSQDDLSDGKVADTECGEFPIEDRQANAAYIVHACNTLAELQKPCVWTWEGKFACYTMSCGNSIGSVGTDLVPKPFKFCHYCRKPIQSHPIQEVTEE